LFRSIDTFRGESGFLTWLYRVVANVVQGRFRKKSIPTISLHALDKAGRETLDLTDPSAADEVDRLSVEKLMARLPSIYRTILVLHDIRGFRHVEIAKMLGMPIGTTKAYLHRARRQLRDLFLESLARQKKPLPRRPSRGRKKLACTPELLGA
jgi:RNA polymerase sigma factor (sigma-70 family)